MIPSFNDRRCSTEATDESSAKFRVESSRMLTHKVTTITPSGISPCIIVSKDHDRKARETNK